MHCPLDPSQRGPVTGELQCEPICVSVYHALGSTMPPKKGGTTYGSCTVSRCSDSPSRVPGFDQCHPGRVSAAPPAFWCCPSIACLQGLRSDVGRQWPPLRLARAPGRLRRPETLAPAVLRQHAVILSQASPSR